MNSFHTWFKGLRIRKPVSKQWQIIYGLLAVIILLAGYEFLSYRRHEINPNDTTLPSLVQMVKAVSKITTPQGFEKKVWLWEDSKATFSRLFKGVLFGSLTGILLGLLMGCFDSFNSFWTPILGFWKAAPATAMLAVFFALVGTGETLYIALIAVAVLPILALTVSASARQDVSMRKINKSYTLGASNSEVVTEIVFPQVLPKIIDAVRIQIGPAMVYLIAAELYVAQVGFGYRLRIQSRLLHMDVVYDYIIILAAVGLLLDFLMVLSRRSLCPWFEKVK